MLEIPWYILVGVMFVCFFIGFCLERYEKMGNVISVKNEPVKRCIRDMVKGEIGYTLPMAYRNKKLNEMYAIYKEKRGNASLRVECIRPHKYSLEFEGRK